MANTMLLSTRMMLAYGNHVLKANISAVTLENCSTATGSSTDHLLYEAPQFQWVSTAPSADPAIKFTMGTVCPSGTQWVGLVNTNIPQSYHTMKVQGGANIGGPWTDLGEVDLLGMYAVTLWQGVNHDLLFKLALDAAGYAYHRFLFVRTSGSRPALRIGQLLLMRGFEVTQNPVSGGMSHDVARDMLVIYGLGGSQHIARGGKRHHTQASYKWERITDGMMQTLQMVYELHGYNLVGIVQPNQAGAWLPIGMPHLFGYLSGFKHRPEQGLGVGSHRNTVSFDLTGAT